MRHFLKRILILLLCSIAAVALIYVGIGSVTDRSITGLAQEAFHVRAKAGRYNEDCRVVYLGDSVCNQLWDSSDADEDGICHLGCTQALTPVGSYLLLREYLENNPQTEQVWFLITPQDLANDIWLDYSYQYLILPFLDEENRALLDEGTLDRIYEKFGRLFVDSSYVKTVMLNNNLFMQAYLNSLHPKDEVREYKRISETAGTYLKKMDELCSEKGVELIVRPNPLPDVSDNHEWEVYRHDMEKYGFEELMADFLEEIPYYPVDWFYDGVHFSAQILEEYGDEIRSNVLT